MMKNRAGLLALLVLAIAAIVMIFFVLPNRKDAQDIAENAGKSVTETAEKAAGAVEEAAEKAGRLKDGLTSPEVLEKMERLKSNAEAAAEALQALFANGRIPSKDEIAEAKSKAEDALSAMAEFETPDGLETAVGDVVSSMKEKASKALDVVKSMPEDAGSAANALAGLSDLLGAPAAEKGSEATTQVAVDVPAFDILRVEKDGSTVIAGTGAPGAKIELMDGDNVIATETVGQAGDFAIVLDTPLSVGDHQLVLRTTAQDGAVTVSQEVATVSVPADEKGELLAMVSKPGEASRILTMPDGAEKTEVAAAAGAVKTENTDKMPATEDAAQGSSGSTIAMPPLPDASSVLANSAPMAVGQTAEATETPVVSNAEIRVNAVELEGDKMFVAGTAKPGATVRVYADDQIVGEAVADAEGNFVAEGVMDLAVGNHIVRTDVVEAGSGKVVVRASVPFNRPEGEQLAVVAKTGDSEQAAMGGDAAAAQLTQLREEVAKALVLLKGLFANGNTPTEDELAAARSATKIALSALSNFKPADNADAELKAASTQAASSAAKALKLLDGAGEDATAVADAISGVEMAAADAIAPVTESQPATEDMSAMTEKPAATEAPSASPEAGNTGKASSDSTAESEASSTEMTSSEGTSEPKTIEQAPLEASNSAVIIRKGDTLWQISRRIYGKGVRYTTIYLANKAEITDPNMINPGQVFKVPEEMLQDDSQAEETNRELQSR